MLWTIVAVLLILWLLGFSLSIGGSLIHLLLVGALVVFVINLMSGRRGAVWRCQGVSDDSTAMSLKFDRARAKPLRGLFRPP